jgi:hypothetical protein
MPHQLAPAQQVHLGTTSNDRQHRQCRLCRKKGHQEEWCPEDHCRVKTTHAYYARGTLCKTAMYDIGEPLPEDEDDDSFDIEERPKD